MNKTRILFIVLGHIASGELTIAAEFAKRLPEEKFSICFVVPEQMEKRLTQYGLEAFVLHPCSSKANQQIFDELIASFHPDYMIASDVYTLEYSSSWSGVDIRTLKKYGIPVGSFDEYEWASTNWAVDYYGGAIRELDKITEDCDFLIRNCPFNKPRAAQSNIRFSSLFDSTWDGWAVARDQCREEWGVNEPEKVILVANSNWEYLNVTKSIPLARLIPWLPKIMHAYLAALKMPVTVIHIGPYGWDFDMAASVHYHHLNSLPASVYERYLCGADLFLSTNLVSVTLSKCVFGQVPSLVLQNPRSLDFDALQGALKNAPDWFTQMAHDVQKAYPFRVFPWGWQHFLRPAIQDNPYMDCFDVAPIFEAKKTINALQRCLYDTQFIQAMRQRQADYASMIVQLPTPEEIMQSLHQGGLG